MKLSIPSVLVLSVISSLSVTAFGGECMPMYPQVQFKNDLKANINIKLHLTPVHSGEESGLYIYPGSLADPYKDSYKKGLHKQDYRLNHEIDNLAPGKTSDAYKMLSYGNLHNAKVTPFKDKKIECDTMRGNRREQWDITITTDWLKHPLSSHKQIRHTYKYNFQCTIKAKNQDKLTSEVPILFDVYDNSPYPLINVLINHGKSTCMNEKVMTKGGYKQELREARK